ncbi:hypothetical protein CHS0354_023853 [Potamilus streckersoni]|uniref:PorV/PorQ family protein n=1 Tax=Potamilus streckersoni TaxID=2493646 RepID=A0AAE0RZ45_9BIVA|nr:hypothetical protein CHS0354_023853 [Potamilus streckersoni]
MARVFYILKKQRYWCIVCCSVTVLFFTRLASAQWNGVDSWIASMGDAAVAVTNSPFASVYNPAGLSFLSKEYHLGASFVNRFLISDMNEVYVGFADAKSFPSHICTYSVVVSSSGFQDLFHETTASLSYSILIGKQTSLGATVNYRSTLIKNYGVGHGVFFDVGAVQVLVPEFIIGVSVKNVGNVGNVGNSTHNINPTFAFGATYLPLDEFQISVDVIKEDYFPISVKTGVAYEPMDFFGFALGVISYPLTFTVGFGVRLNLFEIKYALAYHTELAICAGPVTELIVEKNTSSGGGFLFVDAIDGHKIVYSISNMSGVFAPPREKFYVVTVTLPKQIKYEFVMIDDVFDGGKKKFIIRQHGGGLFVDPVKMWTEAEAESFQF